ncbi:hypothetical protein EIP75_01450 [Aquabacterium soli]|uniref:Uncharacterized protein n=1 Tax=Aquabacterium soli TaxID=2493092 RepID=A0A426VH93_9BURK|nr:hypothetical protein [Aquabacterium soli]RRS06278.1 hypothetical protein EIP75_01450 [Aquabacterium soli]
MAWVLGACVAPAWATSSEVHGPVELQINAQGRPCAYVRAGSPNEAKQGWSIQLWQGGPHEAEQGGTPAWQIDADPGSPAHATWPNEASKCIALPSAALMPSRPYLLEISSIRLYRSRFCWQPMPQGKPAHLVAVDSESGRCTAQPWVGQDGHALRMPAWWDRFQNWWRGLPRP